MVFIIKQSSEMGENAFKLHMHTVFCFLGKLFDTVLFVPL